MRPRWTTIAATLLIAACQSASDPWPAPAVLWVPAPPAITPIPAPDPLCIAQMNGPGQPAEPRKLRHVQAQVPKPPRRIRSLVPSWMGVAEIGTDGSVTNVRTLRPIRADPPWPELQESIVTAIRQWKYEPPCVDGHPAKTELTITVRIEYR